MPRVLLLIPSMVGVGGTERMVDSLSELLANSGWDVHQATFDGPESGRHFESPTPMHRLGPIPRLPLPLRPVAYALTAWRLHRLKHRLGIDVTISNLWGADLISVLAGGADRKVALCHINIVGNPSNRLMMDLRPLVAAVYRRFDRVIAVSETLAHELQSLYRLKGGQSGHIDNFVDRPEVRSCLPDDGVKRFIWCGRFKDEKNVGGLLHAWALFSKGRSHVQLVLLGEGPLLEDMRSLTNSLGLRSSDQMYGQQAQVVFAGRVGEPAAFMLGARSLLLSSVAEGLPMVVLEALSLGVPVLAADCPAGGVRTALLGAGQCNPSRAAAETTTAGLLLPIPTSTEPETLACWHDALCAATDDDALVRQWGEGAALRAELFSSRAAARHWGKVLAFEETHR